MSISIHCFEGLSVQKLSCLCLCKRKRKNDDNPVLMIQDIECNFWVINAHKNIIDNVEKSSPKEEWDVLILGKDKNVTQIDGMRFEALRKKGNYVGKSLEEVFPESVSDVLDPLVDYALKNEKSTQLHTIFRQKQLTLFVYPMKNEKDKIIGAQIIYRPSKYTKSDISSIISDSLLSTNRRKSTTI